MTGSAAISGTVRVVDNVLEGRPADEGVVTSAICGSLSTGMGSLMGSAGSKAANQLTEKALQGTKMVTTAAVSAGASAITSATVTVAANLLSRGEIRKEDLRIALGSPDYFEDLWAYFTKLDSVKGEILTLKQD